MKKNVAGQFIGATLSSVTDGSAFTGSVSVYVTGDNGTRTAGAGTVTNKTGGCYTYAPTQAETNYDHIAFEFTGTGALSVLINVYPSFPQTGDTFASLPANFSALTITTGKVDVNDKTGFSLSGTQTFNLTGNITGNVSGSVGSVSGAVGSISGITFPTNFGLLGINASGHITRVTLVDTITTYTGNTPQTGDSFARIGAAGAGLTALGDTRIANLDATVSSRSTYAGADTAGTTTLLTRVTGAVALASQIPANFTAGTFASAGVFSTGALANAPTGGSAPTAAAIRAEMDANSTKLANLDATMSSRMASFTYTAPPTAAAIRAEMDANSTKLDVAVGTRLASASYTAPDNTTIASINSRLPSDPADQSLVEAAIASATSGLASQSSVNTLTGYVDTEVAAIKTVTDHLATMLELDGVVYRYTVGALALAPSGGSSMTASDIRNAVGLSTANLDTQLSGIQTSVDGISAGTDPLSKTNSQLDTDYAAATVAKTLLRLSLVPGSGPVVTIPDPATNADECVVYLIDEGGNGTRMKSRAVSFELTGYPTSINGSAIDSSPVVFKTDATGFLSGALKRTDLMIPAGRKWVITSPDIGIAEIEFELTDAGPFDLSTLASL